MFVSSKIFSLTASANAPFGKSEKLCRNRTFYSAGYERYPLEQFGASCDLFAAGKVLYSLLANEEDITKFPQISKEMLQDTLAKKLNLIINKACDPAYQNRFASAFEFIQALNKIDKSCAGHCQVDMGKTSSGKLDLG